MSVSQISIHLIFINFVPFILVAVKLYLILFLVIKLNGNSTILDFILANAR